MKTTEEQINEFIQKIRQEKLIQKYLIKRWFRASGSLDLAPITVWNTSVDFFVTTHKNVFSKFIARVEKENPIVKYGCFDNGEPGGYPRISFNFI